MYDLNEFVRVAHAFRETPIVDDDFPEMRERYDLELARLERAVKENGFAVPSRKSVLGEVGVELGKARAQHAGMHSGHEGWAVIQEEVDELWDEVKVNTHGSSVSEEQRRQLMRKEAIQVAAMAVRFVEDVCDGSV